MSTRTPNRADVWRYLGEPHEQQGSANDPRTKSLDGLSWNEQWIYRVNGGANDGRPKRLVLWNRGDYVATFRVGADGALAREDLHLSTLRATESSRS
jgi:hypothetical protein